VNNKVVNITILILIVLFVSFRLTTACNQMDQELKRAESESIEELPVTFSGFIPCADCPGIEYYLLIEEDRFTEIRFYKDRDPESFTKSGEWFLQNDTLTIFDENNEALSTFLFSENQLTLLDQEQQKITGELAEMYVIERNYEESSIRRRHNQLKQEGVDFFASGNEPFWNVQIDFDGNLNYRTIETSQSAPAPEFQSNGNLKIWQANLESGTLIMTVEETYCRDTMSGFLFTHNVTVQLNGQYEMTGCGRFLD
jgi:uncharacterized membrane protein